MPETDRNHVQKLLIVEDHREASEVLSKVAQDVFPLIDVTVEGTVKGGAERIRSDMFDMALIDIGLPDGNGIDLIQLLAAAQPTTLCIVTTIFDDDAHLFDALRAGASGYLIKGHSPSELSAFLMDAVDGTPALSPGIAQSMLGFFRGSDSGRSASEEQLTDREVDILRLIAKGCQVKEVSRLLDISANTVSHHIKSIYSKLNVHNRAEATAAAVQLNLYKPG